MILEGIVTTVGPGGAVNVAPMAPTVEFDGPAGELARFVLRPFRTARTYVNLQAHPEGVLHVSDDVLLLARAALGPVDPPPPLLPARAVRGWVLADACRAYEFRVTAWEDGDRARLGAEVVRAERRRDFFGFNRAKHAVVEAAILATRTAFLPLDEVEAEFAKLAVLVDKTGGAQEHEAFALLRAHLERVRSGERGA